MKIANWTEAELKVVEEQLLTTTIPPESVQGILDLLSGKASVKTASSKGIKIALRRKGNKLQVSFELNIVNNSVKLSNFTGTDADLAALREVATANGYDLA